MVGSASLRSQVSRGSNPLANKKRSATIVAERID
jgi:hypothetical protein